MAYENNGSDDSGSDSEASGGPGVLGRVGGAASSLGSRVSDAAGDALGSGDDSDRTRSDPRASSRPTRSSELATSRPPDDADVGTFGDEPGLLDRVGDAASSLGSRAADAAGDALEPSEASDDSGGSLFEIDGSADNDTTALDRLSDDRDRSSSLFEMGDSTNDTTALDRLSDDRARSSRLFDMSDGGNGTTAFDRLGDEDDSTAQERLERLGEAEDSEDLYG